MTTQTEIKLDIDSVDDWIFRLEVEGDSQLYEVVLEILHEISSQLDND